MKYLTVFFVSLILLCSCHSSSESQQVVAQKVTTIETESDSIDDVEQYRDTIVGKFNGVEIDTLVAEPIDTSKDRALWSWRIYAKNNSVDTLILSQRVTVKMIYEGDLDGNGKDEFGVRRESESGTWDSYFVYTFVDGEWRYLIDPVWTYSSHFYSDLNEGKDVAERTDRRGYVRVRFSDIRNDEFCIIDTLKAIL